MTGLVFLPAIVFLLFVALCWFAAVRFFSRGKRFAGLAAFATPLPFMAMIAFGGTGMALLLRFTLFHFWFTGH